MSPSLGFRRESLGFRYKFGSHKHIQALTPVLGWDDKFHTMTNSPRDKGYKEKRTGIPVSANTCKLRRRDRASQDWQGNQVSIIMPYKVKWTCFKKTSMVSCTECARRLKMRKILLDLAN